MRRRAGWNKAATARVAAATAQLGVSADPPGQLPQDQDRGGVQSAEQDGEQPVDQGAVDEPVDVVQAIAQDGGADREGNPQRQLDGLKGAQTRTWPLTCWFAPDLGSVA
jgi:hypothetical protein